jgi:hypothetical protein
MFTGKGRHGSLLFVLSIHVEHVLSLPGRTEEKRRDEREKERGTRMYDDRTSRKDHHAGNEQQMDSGASSLINQMCDKLLLISMNERG